MEVTTLCTIIAALRVVPNRSQFFQYESVSLSCESQRNSSDWTIKRTTSQKTEECFISWNNINGSLCFIDDIYTFNSGVYWCESAAGGCSNVINVTVTAGPVILDSPFLPVTEGDAVTLSCRTKKTSSNLAAVFYKDGVLIGSSSTGNMTLRRVSKSDEGLYKCSVSGTDSPDSWLTVSGRPDSPPADSPPDSPITRILLPVVGGCLSLVSLVCVMLLCLWRSHKGEINPSVVLYTNVSGTLKLSQKGDPLRRRSCALSSVAEYKPHTVKCKSALSPVWTYKA
ncbi:high affinity immunoglobulin gamma Fc receptor I-like isoform X2 [Plectropomus leopardus]|uniref:high affinity immunoglobulin gamma Fc receptor I-like isoform X2 n=1 Tax=Plectropomus leopardus TaxID=160734 RepID=UPI001C4C057E|nr:high affinity immunoglobulin gamma Fc receptor I-like isoform X2 [Plectropomus leopardus]